MHNELQRKSSQLTGRQVYDERELRLNQLIAANRVLIRALDGGDVSEDELKMAREVVNEAL